MYMQSPGVRPSVCLSVCPKSEFYRNGWMDESGWFWHRHRLILYFMLGYMKIRSYPKQKYFPCNVSQNPSNLFSNLVQIQSLKEAGYFCFGATRIPIKHNIISDSLIVAPLPKASPVWPFRYYTVSQKNKTPNSCP